MGKKKIQTRLSGTNRLSVCDGAARREGGQPGFCVLGSSTCCLGEADVLVMDY